ncbi:restriction endonuclease subunit S [Zhongshania sp.]|jgi:type I restriction enzyme S subunit|uniref:restriction endonuclease subunit S n=1 Tax=Zhongshania sp. TaxID=1971902 RepID=UPI002A7F4A93|nr:restriction endonuclease subunit S [Zhongshania sp.]
MSKTDNKVNASLHSSHSCKSTNDKFVEPSISIPIGEVADVIAGGTPKANDPKNFATPKSGIAWLTPADLSGFKNKYIAHGARDLSESGYNSSSAKLLPAGTIVFSSRAPIGYLAIAQNAISTNQGFKNFVLPESIDSTYAYYYLKSIRDVAESLGTGTTFKEISGSTAKTLPFLIFPLAEQKIIADKLDELLAQVDTLKTRLDAIPAALKRFRQSVLAAAVSGKLTEEWRTLNNEKTTKAMLNDFAFLPDPPRYKSRSTSFIAGVHATAVGKPEAPLPKEWAWIPLVKVARMESGHTPSRSKPEYWGGKVFWIGIKDARRNHEKTIYETEQTTNELGLANSASRLLPKDTVCISRTASVGYVVKMGSPMATSQDFVNWVPSKVINPDWLKWLFVAEKESLFRFGKGSTHTTVYFPEWLSMHIALPHIDEQTEIVRRVEQLLTYADQVEQQVKNAQARVNQLTQSILAKAFRGELTEQWRQDNPELISGDNSAAALLERIKAERAVATPAKKKAKKTTN